jgi:EAL domain-containing protein (putative c-di-GMP-specific phosphodiesterase class I)/DNA-binding response OmpR family regulator
MGRGRRLGPSDAGPHGKADGIVQLADVLDSRIYVADDEPANTALISAVLDRGGYRAISIFSGGADLLEAIEEEEPDLILLDLRMPRLDGYGVLDALAPRRSDGAYLPVLVLTAEGSREARNLALEHGANDYLSKPFDQVELVLRVGNLLQTRRLHRQLNQRNRDLRGEVEATSQRLADHQREWTKHAATLASLEAKESPEATAAAICRQISLLPGLTSVIVLALDAAGNAVPLAANEFADARIAVNRPLPPELTNEWRKRVRNGSWIGPWPAPLGTQMRRQPQDATAMAIVPLRTSAASLGALVVATASAEGTQYLADRLPALESFGALAAALLAPGIMARQQREVLRRQIDGIIGVEAFSPVFQPVVELASGAVVGYEALTRFADGTRPDRMFADAAAVGLGTELELVCLAAALDAADALPHGRWLSLNVSPALILEPRRLERLAKTTSRPLVLEVTEHVAIEDYSAFRESVAAIGSVRYAVDDAGAGFASFRHILELRPDFVKLDIGLVHDIDADHVRQALVAGLVYFARKSGCQLIAEGIETTAERQLLETLGAELGQGYLLGRPAAAKTLTDPSTARPAGGPSWRRSSPSKPTVKTR